MAYTTLPTYVTNQLITAAHANTYWRDNINELWPFEAAGDIPFASDTDALNKLAIGTASKVLRVNAAGAAPEWGAPANAVMADLGDNPQSVYGSTPGSVLATTITLTGVCSVIVFIAGVLKTSNGSYGAWIKAHCNGVNQDSGKYTFSTGYAGLNTFALFTNVPAGTIDVKAMIYSGVGTQTAYANYVTLVAIAIPE